LLVVAGLSFSYLRMSWKVSQFDRLRADLDHLRVRYVDLQRQANQHKVQMASLEVLASEVSVAYGINQPLGFLDGTPMDSDSMANLHESIEQYNFLQSASFDGIYHHYAFRWQSHNQPSLWPVIGVLRSSFGGRSDPFSGEGAFHTGVDLQVPKGSSVHATADGVVERAGWSGKYGKLVVIDHGNGLKTYYAHLSQYDVVPGQAVRRGEVIALSGATGHATGPHVHYEVRLSGTPVNPYRYLAKGPNPQRRSATHASDLGL
jgi:murein DD-endopeptidase MepM/ murein hydrolase activator NlpD